jgi:hypothetical protein
MVAAVLGPINSLGFFGVLLSCLACGCGAQSAIAPPRAGAVIVDLDESFEIEVTERRSVQDTDLRIAFVGVADDSRCPEGSDCSGPGNAQIQLALSGNRTNTTVTLNTRKEPRSVEFSGYEIVFESLEPEPEAGEVLGPQDYEATLRVLRR